MVNLTLHSNTESFIGDIKQLAEQGRNAAYGAVNAVMIETYWRIGQRIVEQEQKGKERAEYGTQLIEMLSEELTKTYGKGFSVRDLWLFKQFYLTFNDLEILYTRVQNLTWSHYRTALRVEDPVAARWYLQIHLNRSMTIFLSNRCVELRNALFLQNNNDVLIKNKKYR